MTELLTAEQEIAALRELADKRAALKKMGELLRDDMFCIRRIVEAGGKWTHTRGRWSLYTVDGQRAAGIGTRAFEKFSAYQYARKVAARTA